MNKDGSVCILSWWSYNAQWFCDMQRRMEMDDDNRPHSVCENWFVNHEMVISQVSLSAEASLGWRWQITFFTQAKLGCWFVAANRRLTSSSWVILQHLPSFVQVIKSPALQIILAFLAFLYWLFYHEPKGIVSWDYHGRQQQYWPNKPHLAGILFSPNRVAWIINLYINFPADRKRHVDMSSVSHGDWSWVRWDGRGRTPHSLADAAIPVNSHILFSLPGSERVSFSSLAREGVWHRNRIRSKLQDAASLGLCSSKLSDSLSNWLVLCDALKSRLLFQLTVCTIIISIEKYYFWQNVKLKKDSKLVL